MSNVNEQYAQRLAEARDLVARLERDCPHHFNDEWDSAFCTICRKSFGWKCPSSPAGGDGVCHYWTDSDGKVRLTDGTSIDAPADHDPDLETEDSCIFCGHPEERK